jgi:hypothetical protein
MLPLPVIKRDALASLLRSTVPLNGASDLDQGSQFSKCKILYLSMILVSSYLLKALSRNSDTVFSSQAELPSICHASLHRLSALAHPDSLSHLKASITSLTNRKENLGRLAMQTTTSDSPRTYVKECQSAKHHRSIHCPEQRSSTSLQMLWLCNAQWCKRDSSQSLAIALMDFITAD